MREDVQHQRSEPCAGSILRAELSQCTSNHSLQGCFTGWASFSPKWVIFLSAGLREDGNIPGTGGGVRVLVFCGNRVKIQLSFLLSAANK